MASTIIAPLGNIECPSELVISGDVAIERLPSHMTPVIERAREAYIVRHAPMYSHCLVISGTDFSQQQSDEAKALVERFVLLLRIYRPGNVYFNFAVIDEDGWYRAPTVIRQVSLQKLGVFFYMGWGHRGTTQTLRLQSQDVNPLRELFRAHRGRDLLSERPFRYFFRGFHEPYSEDRFLDNIIGMENILVNDTSDQSNVRYKFVDRGCFLLQLSRPETEGASAYVKPLSALYDLRCRIVHASRKEVDWTVAGTQDLLRRSEEFLRMILRIVLERPELAKAATIDKEKRKLYAETRIGKARRKK